MGFYPQLAAILIFAVVFGGVMLDAVVRTGRAIRRRRASEPPSIEPHAVRRVRRLALLTSVIDFGLVLGFVAFVLAAVYGQGMGGVDAYAIPATYRVLPVVGLLSAALTLAFVAASLSAWRDGAWSRGQRMRHVAVVGAAIAFVPWLAYWQLLGPPL